MSFIMTVLGMIPGLSHMIEFVTGKFFDSKVSIYQTRMGVTKEVAVEAIRAEVAINQTKIGWLNAVAGSRFLQFIVGGFALPWIVYGNKVVIWDNIVHKFIWDTYGFTPPITGAVGEWANVILGGIFVTSTGMGITAAVLNRTKE